MLNPNFTPFPILKTARLALRKLSLKDANEILAIRSNDQINKYIDRTPATTIEDARTFIQKISEMIDRNDGIYWGITSTNSDFIIGTICLFNFSVEECKCEIGYELLPSFQGQGLMTEAISKVIEFCFDSIDIKEIEAEVRKDNQQSIRLIEKFNFKRVGETDEANPDYIVFSHKGDL